MGVPKFFRYISERYPCLSQLILESDIPEFDNLYLDMNGIIHNCSHPNDYDPQFRITEEKIFKDIFNYIEALFRIIKPKKLFFMAVDGVAPRAKMNQQRGRRFRSAKETEDRDSEAVNRGVRLPDAPKFDSNCITPGTSFMAKLQAQLRFFVASKISTDKLWQKVKIVLSGHECPGEGEHKIMDYIRFMRSQPDYDPNTKHCLYGLDADLIMLGLCTHEPHFALLREEVKFGRKQQSKKILAPEEIKFFLLHLSLLREYLEMEFSCLKELLPFGFNLENIIDDWVLMGFLVGNDFIPNLPGMHINSGALSVLYKAYCEILPTLDGYLNEAGILNLERFEVYMKKLASFDIKHFREQYDDMKYLKAKTSKNGYRAGGLKEENIGFSNALQPYFEDDEEIVEEDLGGMKRCVKIMDDENKGTGSDGDDDSGDECVDMDKAVLDMMDLDESDGSEYYDEDDKEADRLAFFQEFCLHKKVYYQEKLEYKRITPAVLRSQAEGYIKALQWNLHYYYNGLCSWSWYYPHHYAPYMSDIQNFKDMEIEFEPGKPFLPFQQLLAVLPSFSKDLLPKPFQELMTDETSPIVEYYPLNFSTDLNEKKNDWEAVVLIPFIDEERLLNSMEACYHRLTDEEKERNKHGPMHVFTYSEDVLGRLESPAYFGAIEKNHALDTPLYREEILVPQEKLRKGLLEGALVGVYFPGFPTFKNLEYTSVLRAAGVKIFQAPSQGMNMIVLVKSPEKESTHEDVVEEFLNRIVHVNWPYLTEALVVGVRSTSKETALEGKVSRTFEPELASKFSVETRQTNMDLLKSRGIDVGQTNFLLRVRQFEGQKFSFNSKTSAGDVKIELEKRWGNAIRSVPLQVVITNTLSKTKIDPNVTLDEIFPIGRNCFLLNPKHYGCLGIVNDKAEDDGVKVRITVPPEPEFEDINICQSEIYYYTNNEAAQQARLSSHLLARITGTILVLDTNDPLMMDKAQKVNIGLNLKFSRRNQQLPGYTRRTENNQWLYSDRTIKLVREYADAFPDVIKYLAKNSDKDLIFKNDIFPSPGQAHMLNEISNWLNSRSELKTERRSCDAEILEPDQILELEYRVEQFMKKNKRGRYVNLKVKPFHLYLPSSTIEKTSPDNADFRQLDRVVNVRDNFIVPLGYRGTIIGLEEKTDDSAGVQCDILFDQPFGGAEQYHTKKKRVFRMPDKCLLNITYAKSKFAREEVISAKTTQNQQKQRRQIIPARTNERPNALVTPDRNKSALSANREHAAPIPISSLMSHFAHHPAAAATSKPLLKTTPVFMSGGVPCRTITTSNEIEADGEQVRKSMESVRTPEQKKETVRTSIEKTNPTESIKEPTNTLKKLLKISAEDDDGGSQSSVKQAQMLTVAELERGNASKDYTIELQDIFMKLGQPSPHYEYELTNGSTTATLYLPNIEIGVAGDPAPSKKMAAERAAFVVLQYIGLVNKFGDRVTGTEVSGRSLRDLYKRIGLLKDRLYELHRTQVAASQTQQAAVPPAPLPVQQQQQQPAGPVPPPQQQQQYPAQPLPPMMGVPTMAQYPTLPQVGTVPMPSPQQSQSTYNANLVRPTPQFPGNVYTAAVYQPRPVANYLFQQPLLTPQQQYYQQANFRPAFSVSSPLSIPTSATFAVTSATNMNVPQFNQQHYVVNNTNAAAVVAAAAAANGMPRVRLQSQFAQTPTTVFNAVNVSNSPVIARFPTSVGLVRGNLGTSSIYSKAVGSSSVPRPQTVVHVRPFLNDRGPAVVPTTGLETEFEAVHFNPIQQDSVHATTDRIPAAPPASSSASVSTTTTRNDQEDLSLFSSGRVSKTPRKSRLAANFATKPSA